MKNLLFFAVVIGMLACTATRHDGYVIEGTITGDSVATGKVYLSNLSKEDPIKDTVEMVNGKFTFDGKVSTPEDYVISFERIKGRISLFLDNSKIKIEAAAEEIEKASVTGGKTNDLVSALRKQQKETYQELGLDSLEKEYYAEGTSQARKDSISNIFDNFDDEIKKADSLFIAENPTSPYTLILYINKIEEYKIPDMEAKLATFKAIPEFAENRYLKALEEGINTLKALQPGMKAPAFTMTGPDSLSVSLVNIYPKNKVTMIDFWASWCGPCRRFNPTLKYIYYQFNKAGFGIIGVSLDKSKEAWIKGIAEDKLVWDQVSDLKFWDNAVAKLYHVKYIPQNIFIDQNGIILKRQVPEDQIVPFLKEQLGIETAD